MIALSKNDYSAELLKMEGVQIEKLEECDSEIVMQLSLRRKKQTCKRCGAGTDRVHDYRVRQVRDLELRGKPLRILYRQRRYVCPACGKRFSEQNDFVGRYMRFTHRTGEKIMSLLRRRSSMKDIAKDTGTSVSGVQRVLKMMPISKPQHLPEAISFDEFKGNTGGQRFQCIVTDPLNHSVFDILPARTVGTIQDYLLTFPNRDEVKYVVMDMNRGFRDAAKAFLPNAQIIIDRFHVVRFCTEAMDNVRRSFQAVLPNNQRKYFKRSRRLLLAHRNKLSDEDRAAVDVMLRFSDRLMQAYALKEAFYDFMDAPDRATASNRLEYWLDACDRLKIPEFKPCRRMLINWKPYILNAFDFHFSNGFTEGCNNAIKALKRVAFGFRRFDSLRARALLAFSPHPNI